MSNTGGNLKIWIAPAITTFSVTIYANYLNDPTSETLGDYAIYWSLNSDPDNLLVYGDSISTSCANVGTISGISYGDTLHVGFTTTGKVRTARNFDGNKTTSCPNTGDLTYCGTNNVGGTPLSVASINSDSNVALTIYSAKGIFSTCP